MPSMPVYRLILSDLDGTLLDERGMLPTSWGRVRSTLDSGDLFTLVSRRTVTELLAIQEALGVHGPLIAENGSLLVLGAEWPGVLAGRIEQVDGRPLRVVSLGSRRTPVLTMMREIAAACNLAVEFTGDPAFVPDPGESRARIVVLDDAATRHRSLLVQVAASRRQKEMLDRALAASALSMVHGGRWQVVQCGTNKGIAASVLRNMLHAQRYRPLVIAVGDHANDRPMLEMADVRIAVRRADGSVHPALADLPDLHVPERPGPSAWADIADFLDAREASHA